MNLSEKIDYESGLSKASHSLVDDKIMNIYDRTLDKLDSLGVAWDPKKLKLRNMRRFLDETENINGTVSGKILKRFKVEMTLRKEKLAFALDKKYHLKKFDREIYQTLIAGTNLDKNRPLSTGRKLNAIENGGDLIVAPVFKKELDTNIN
jgi:hypothetical protein